MSSSHQTAGRFANVGRFFKVVVSGQAYLNLLYLLVAFPLGILYFVLLVSGLSLGIPLLIIWVGIPILLLVGALWWALASFERLMAIHWLKEDVPAMARPFIEGADVWTGLREYLANPVTWKSLLYLFMKFPLGIAAFVVLTTLISLMLALLAMPFMYELGSVNGFLPEFQAGVFLSPGLPAWHMDSLNDALLVALIGLMLWPVTLHVTNGLAWLHAKFARVMLSVDPMGQ